MNKYNKCDLRKFIDSIPQDEVDRRTKEQDIENKRMHDEFVEGMATNKCFLCKGTLDSYDKMTPCFHWFLYPDRIKKKRFKNYLNSPIGFFQLDSYFRWMANHEKPLGNINDLKHESPDSVMFSTTYRYKNIEWSLVVGEKDKEGHKGSNFGGVPHFHLQMKINDQIFLKFNDYHIPFKDSDLFTLSLLEQAGDKIELGHCFGYGAGLLEKEETLKYVDEHSVITDDRENATFERDTFFRAAEGETISGELIQEAIIESEKTKEPIGKIMQRYLAKSNQEVAVTTIISPGKGVPKKVLRGGRGKKKEKQ